MLTERFVALSVLMALTLSACDEKSSVGGGEEEGASAGEEEGASAGEASAGEDDDGEEPPPEPMDDFGRAGQACDQSVLSAACRSGGADGLEFCAWDLDGYDYVWTACLVEACAEAGASRACEGGTQYCAGYAAEADAQELRWGACGEAGECEDGAKEECFPGDEYMSGIYMYCTSDENGRPTWNYDDCNTPLVLNFGGELRFEAAPTAAADFNAAGEACTRADWPTAQTPWLALDRDGNGSIDGGRELFGSATRLSAGTDPHNGFQALAELDSDGDGEVSPADARWGELVLWADHDADRRSSGWEMLPLASFEIVSIDLGYEMRRDCDERGNCGVERAGFVYRTMGQERVGEVVDVHLACE
jgi:hypothetical protein